MAVEKIAPRRQLAAAEIALKMKAAGLPDDFVAAVLDCAIHQEGFLDLVELWDEAVAEERDAIVADLYEHLEDTKETRSTIEKPKIGFKELDKVVGEVLVFKKHLRELVDRHGGVTEVARRSGIPQPSLSRILYSASMPRRTTLYKIAKALDVPESEIVTEWAS